MNFARLGIAEHSSGGPARFCAPLPGAARAAREPMAHAIILFFGRAGLAVHSVALLSDVQSGVAWTRKEANGPFIY